MAIKLPIDHPVDHTKEDASIPSKVELADHVAKTNPPTDSTKISPAIDPPKEASSDNIDSDSVDSVKISSDKLRPIKNNKCILIFAIAIPIIVSLCGIAVLLVGVCGIVGFYAGIPQFAVSVYHVMHSIYVAYGVTAFGGGIEGIVLLSLVGYAIYRCYINKQKKYSQEV